MATFKRPIVRQRASGGVSTQQRVSPTASGFVADMCRTLNTQTPATFRRPVWTPPRDHVSYFAALQARGENTEQFERMTEEFYLKYPPVVKPEPDYSPIYALANKYYGQGEPPRDELTEAMRACGVSEENIMSYMLGTKVIQEHEYILYVMSAPSVSKGEYDQGPMNELNERYYSKCQKPPVLAVMRAMRKAGYSDERVDKFAKWHKRMEDTYQERTEALEKIFAKWPSASKGPVKKKVIKAVKKNI